MIDKRLMKSSRPKLAKEPSRIFREIYRLII